MRLAALFISATLTTVLCATNNTAYEHHMNPPCDETIVIDSSNPEPRFQGHSRKIFDEALSRVYGVTIIGERYSDARDLPKDYKEDMVLLSNGLADHVSKFYDPHSHRSDFGAESLAYMSAEVLIRGDEIPQEMEQIRTIHERLLSKLLDYIIPGHWDAPFHNRTLADNPFWKSFKDAMRESMKSRYEFGMSLEDFLVRRYQYLLEVVYLGLDAYMHLSDRGFITQEMRNLFLSLMTWNILQQEYVGLLNDETAKQTVTNIIRLVDAYSNSSDPELHKISTPVSENFFKKIMNIILTSNFTQGFKELEEPLFDTFSEILQAAITKASEEKGLDIKSSSVSMNNLMDAIRKVLVDMIGGKHIKQSKYDMCGTISAIFEHYANPDNVTTDYERVIYDYAKGIDFKVEV